MIDLKNKVEEQMLNQAIKDRNEIQVDTDLDDNDFHSAEELIDQPGYSILVKYSYNIKGSYKSADRDTPPQDERELNVVEVDRIYFSLEDASEFTKLTKEQEKQLIESLNFI